MLILLTWIYRACLVVAIQYISTVARAADHTVVTTAYLTASAVGDSTYIAHTGLVRHGIPVFTPACVCRIEIYQADAVAVVTAGALTV